MMNNTKAQKAKSENPVQDFLDAHRKLEDEMSAAVDQLSKDQVSRVLGILNKVK